MTGILHTARISTVEVWAPSRIQTRHLPNYEFTDIWQASYILLRSVNWSAHVLCWKWIGNIPFWRCHEKSIIFRIFHINKNPNSSWSCPKTRVTPWHAFWSFKNKWVYYEFPNNFYDICIFAKFEKIAPAPRFIFCSKKERYKDWHRQKRFKSHLHWKRSCLENLHENCFENCFRQLPSFWNKWVVELQSFKNLLLLFLMYLPTL